MDATRHPDAAPGVPLWLYLAVWCSSWRWRPRRKLPPPDTRAVHRALAAGWTLRSASPRWDMVWRNHRKALRRARIILVPDTGFGMTPAERLAMLRDRLAEPGFAAPPPDPCQLRAAQRKRIAALAPGWLDALSDRDIARWWTR